MALHWTLSSMFICLLSWASQYWTQYAGGLPSAQKRVRNCHPRSAGNAFSNTAQDTTYLLCSTGTLLAHCLLYALQEYPFCSCGIQILKHSWRLPVPGQHYLFWNPREGGIPRVHETIIRDLENQIVEDKTCFTFSLFFLHRLNKTIGV